MTQDCNGIDGSWFLARSEKHLAKLLKTSMECVQSGKHYHAIYRLQHLSDDILDLDNYQNVE